MAEIEDGARERIGTIPMYVMTTSIFRLNGAVDRGELIGWEEIREAINDGSALEWLATTPFGDRGPVLPEFAHGEWAPHRIVLDDLFLNLANAVDTSRKFLVERNGLCVVLAYFVEALQLWAEARGVRP